MEVGQLRLKEWMIKNDVSQAEMARQLGISKSYMHKIIHTGQFTPKIAKAIESITKGEVTASDALYSETIQTNIRNGSPLPPAQRQMFINMIHR
jgi:DNA-binding transcriptional regulator YdaS (Cro superfamily)